MSRAEISANLPLGDVLPCYYDKHHADYLFVSLSELIMERVFYHPNVEQVMDKLSVIEKSSIEAILNAQPVQQHYVNTLVGSIMTELEPQHKRVRVSLSGVDTYAFRSLLGGVVEPLEVNPALGHRGVIRFTDRELSQGFQFECEVIKALLAQHVTVDIVVPFVRTQHDVNRIFTALEQQQLDTSMEGLTISLCCDVPATVLSAKQWLTRFDGLVIHVDNLTQFVLGLDKSNEELEDEYNPQDESVLQLIEMALDSAQALNKPVLVVTQALQDYPQLQQLLITHGQCDVVVTM